MSTPDLFLFAGEPSGDFHGYELLKALRKNFPDLKVGGVGGPLMRSEKFQTFAPMEDFQVMGFSDVLFSLPKLVKRFSEIRNHILKSQPKAVIFIDYPGFNLRLAQSLRKRGFKNKLVHYIAPTVWAWGKNRIQKMAKSLDLLLTIFPFEEEFFKESSLKVNYVGNPIMSALQNYVYKEGWQKRIAVNKELIAVFPGSRQGEIKRNFPLHLRAMALLKKELPHLQFAVSLVSADLLPLIKKIAEDLHFQDFEIVEKSFSYDLMRFAKAAIAKSGTVTLELALHGCPTVVTYELSRLNYLIAKHLIKIDLPHYCISNILLQETLFPEMIGIDLCPNLLAQKALSILHQPAEIKERALLLKQLLGEQNASENAAEAIGKLIGCA